MGLLPAFLVACSQGFATDEIPKPVTIEVEPTDVFVVSGPGGGTPLELGAWATYETGEVVDVSDVVEWSVSNRSAGDISAEGVFTPSTANGGTTWILAALAGLEGFATVTVIYSDELVVDDADPSLFADPSPEVLSEDAIVYPEDGVNIPRNTPSISFQWLDLGADAYQLTFSSGITDVSVTTTSTHWEADEATWQKIAATNAGGTVDVTLAASFAGEVEITDPITMSVNRMDARGSIIYWSTSAAGLREIPYGEPAAEFMTSAQSGYCVGCHAISSTSLVAFTYDGGNGPLGIKRTDDLSDVVGHGGGVSANFKTFSPDGTYLLGTFNGVLTLYDGVTGAQLHDVPLDGTATHVDWSPDGDSVALVLTDDHYADWVFDGSRVAVMDHYGDGVFGEPRVVVDFGMDYNAYYPAWSPDGKWIAFNRSTGDSYDDPDATLWVVDPIGGEPIYLEAANQVGDLTNSWPRWGPLPDDDILWLAFASKRTYGNVTADVPQIWVNAFDPDRAKAGEDPSWPAFWLPDQAHNEGNHIPVWVE